MNQSRFGIWWACNVSGPTGPIPSFGKVYFVTNDFGDLVLVYKDQLNLSLA